MLGSQEDTLETAVRRQMEVTTEIEKTMKALGSRLERQLMEERSVNAALRGEIVELSTQISAVQNAYTTVTDQLEISQLVQQKQVTKLMEGLREVRSEADSLGTAAAQRAKKLAATEKRLRSVEEQAERLADGKNKIAKDLKDTRWALGTVQSKLSKESGKYQRESAANAQLQEQVAAAEEQKITMEQRVASVEGEKALMDMRIEEMSGKLAEADKLASDLEASRWALKNVHANLAGEGNMFQSEMEEQEQAALEQKIASVEGVNARLEGQVETISGKLKAVEEENSTLADKVQTSQWALKTVQSNLASKAQQLEREMAANAQLQAEVATAKEQKTAAEQTAAEVEAEKAMMDKKMEEMSSELEKADKLATDLETSRWALRTVQSNLASKARQLESEIAANAQLQAEVATAREEISALERRVTEVEAEKAIMDKKMTEILGKLENAEKVASELETSRWALRTVQSNLAGEAQKLQREMAANAQLRAEAATAKEDKTAAEQRVAKAEAEKAIMDKKMAEISGKLEKADNVASELETSRWALKTVQSNLASEAQKLQNEIAANAQLQAEAAAAKAEKIAMGQMVTSVEGEKAVLKGKVAAMSDKLEEADKVASDLKESRWALKNVQSQLVIQSGKFESEAAANVQLQAQVATAEQEKTALEERVTSVEEEKQKVYVEAATIKSELEQKVASVRSEKDKLEEHVELAEGEKKKIEVELKASKKIEEELAVRLSKAEAEENRMAEEQKLLEQQRVEALRREAALEKELEAADEKIPELERETGALRERLEVLGVVEQREKQMARELADSHKENNELSSLLRSMESKLASFTVKK